MIAGTSTGGILSCIYLVPGDDGNAKYSAQDAVDLYIKNGQTIFDRTTAQKISSVGGILHQKYSQDALYELLTTYFGDVTLNQLIKPSLITSYDITDRRAIFFTSADAREDNIYNFYVRDVARATSAAPTYFSPAHIESLNKQIFSLVDGGMFANNPALCAYAEARKLEFSKLFNNPEKKDKPTAADMIIVSMGTGSVKKQYHYDDFKYAGEIKWLEPVIDVLMSGNSETVAYQLTQMYLTLEPENQKNYYRLEPGLKEACSEMDIATDENINNLYQAGLTFVHDNKNLLEEIAKKILDND
jgi:patatin-like phospholipase/acyl hydrolase